MAWLAANAPYVKAGASVLSVISNERAAKVEQQRLRAMAGSERASSQRQAGEERRRARLLESRARAVAAASGAGVSDPSVVNTMADISAEGEYRALTRMYEGETAAQSMELEGRERRKAARARSVSTILNTAADTFATKYG